MDTVTTEEDRMRYAYELTREGGMVIGLAARVAGVHPDDLFRYIWRKHPVRGTLILLIAYGWAVYGKLTGR